LAWSCMDVDVKGYILELLNSWMWVFPVKGKGKDLNEGKKPLSFKEGDEVVTWKDKRILGYAEELARKGHEAWAIWLQGSSRFGFDIDIYKAADVENKDEVRRRIVEELRKRSEFYSEMSGRGGIHVIAYALRDEKLKEESGFSWLEYKHDGYFIIFPSVLRTPEKEYRYEWLGGDILTATDYDKVVVSLSEILSKALGRRVDVVVEKVGRAGAVRKRGGGGAVVQVSTQGVEEVRQLDALKLKVLLYLLFKKAGCKGLEKLMREWITKGYIPLLYGTWYMDIPRSTRMLFEHTVLSIAFFAGASEDQLGKLYDEMVFKHGGRVEDAGDNWENIIHNISRGTLNLIRKGRCPFCVLAGVGGFCPSFPLSKVMQLSRDYISVLVRRLAT